MMPGDVRPLSIVADVTLLGKLRAGRERLLRQLASFGVIGAVNFVVDTAIFNLLFVVGPVKAQVVATIVATTLSYFLNRHWTFREHTRSGLRREYTLFFLLNGVGLAITAAIVGVAKYGFDLHDQLALNVVRLFAIGVDTLFRFWSYRRWVFGAVAESDTPVDQAEETRLADEIQQAEAAGAAIPAPGSPVVLGSPAAPGSPVVPGQRSGREPVRAER
jgi:putative flippase GtrA